MPSVGTGYDLQIPLSFFKDSYHGEIAFEPCHGLRDYGASLVVDDIGRHSSFL